MSGTRQRSRSPLSCSNHSLMVNQRQGETLFSLSSSLSRVADGQWLRICEELRRVSPNIGQVGEWRALAECSSCYSCWPMLHLTTWYTANWTGPIPPSLPEFEDSSGPLAEHEPPGAQKVSVDGLAPPESVGTPAPEYASRAVTPTDSSSQPPRYFSPARQATPKVDAPPETEDVRDRSLSVNSLASLSSFPPPPTHFPLPSLPSNDIENTRQLSSQSSSSSSSAPQLQPNTPTPSSQTSSTPTAAALGKLRKDSATFFDFASPPASPTNQTHDPTTNEVVVLPGHADGSSAQVQNKGKEPVSELDRLQQSNLTSPASDATKPRTYPQGDYANNSGFGARRAPSVGPSTSPSLPRTVERSDTNRSSSSSVVAVMRDRYTRSVRISAITHLSHILTFFCRPDPLLPLQRISHGCHSVCPT